MRVHPEGHHANAQTERVATQRARNEDPRVVRILGLLEVEELTFLLASLSAMFFSLGSLALTSKFLGLSLLQSEESVFILCYAFSASFVSAAIAFEKLSRESRNAASERRSAIGNANQAAIVRVEEEEKTISESTMEYGYEGNVPNNDSEITPRNSPRNPTSSRSNVGASHSV